MDMTRYPPSSVMEKSVRVLHVLFAGGALGVTSGEIARTAKLSAPDVTRYVAGLAQLGLAEELTDTGRWRAGVKWSQFALAQLRAVERDRSLIAEFEQRASRAPR